MKLLGRLIEILNRVKVARSSREIILQHFLPYLGLTPRTQSSLIVDLMGTPGPMEEFLKIHEGSRDAGDSKIRVVESMETNQDETELVS